MKKLISIVLAVVMMMTVTSTAVSVSAASSSTAIPGTNVYWNITSNGTLTFSGTGDIPNYSSFGDAPWASFNNRKNVKTIILSSGITSIGNKSLYDFYNTTSVIFANDSKLKRIGEDAFYNCYALKNIILPSSLTQVCEDAFYGCKGLLTVSTNAAATFGPDAFWHCDALTSFSAPNAKSIGSYCFGYDANLATIYAPKATMESNCVSSSSNVASITCGTLKKDALRNLSTLTKLNITNAKSIGDYALYGCTGLTSVSSNATSVGDYAFYGCNLLKTVKLPKATSIGNDAFRDLPELTTVSLGKVKKLGEFSFYRCPKIKTVTGLGNLTNAGKYAFARDTKLTKCAVGSKLKTVGERAFYGCKSLKHSFTFKNVTSIDDYAFFACGNIATNSLGNKLKSLGTDAFSGCSKVKSIYVPSTCKKIGYTPFASVKGFKIVSSYSDSYKYSSENKNIKIVCDKNSAMYKFVKDHSWYKYKLGIAVKSVKLNASKITLKKGKTFKLKAYLSPSNVSSRGILLKTSNKKVATVASNGIIKGIKKGKCKITVTATDGSRKSKSVAVTVK